MTASAAATSALGKATGKGGRNETVNQRVKGCVHESDGNKAVGIDGVSIDSVSNVNGFVLSLLL